MMMQIGCSEYQFTREVTQSPGQVLAQDCSNEERSDLHREFSEKWWIYRPISLDQSVDFCIDICADSRVRPMTQERLNSCLWNYAPLSV